MARMCGEPNEVEEKHPPDKHYRSFPPAMLFEQCCSSECHQTESCYGVCRAWLSGQGARGVEPVERGRVHAVRSTCCWVLRLQASVRHGVYMWPTFCCWALRHKMASGMGFTCGSRSVPRVLLLVLRCRSSAVFIGELLGAVAWGNSGNSGNAATKAEHGATIFECASPSSTGVRFVGWGCATPSSTGARPVGWGSASLTSNGSPAVYYRVLAAVHYRVLPCTTFNYCVGPVADRFGRKKCAVASARNRVMEQWSKRGFW